MTNSSNATESATGEEPSKQSLLGILEQGGLSPESPNLGEIGQAIVRAVQAGDPQAAFRLVKNAIQTSERIRLALVLVVALTQVQKLVLARATINLTKYPPHSYGRFLALLAITKASYEQVDPTRDHDLKMARNAARWLGKGAEPSAEPQAFIEVWRWVTRGRLDIIGDPDLDEARNKAQVLECPERRVESYLLIAEEAGMAQDFLGALTALKEVPSGDQERVTAKVMTAIAEAGIKSLGEAGRLDPGELAKLRAGASEIKELVLQEIRSGGTQSAS